MLPSHRSGPERSISLGPTTGIALRIFCISAVAVVAFCLLAVPTSPVHASSGGSLQLGSVTGNTAMVSCQGGQWVAGMNCFVATITGCNNDNNTVDPISFIYGLIIPPGKANGVIVFLDGGDGTNAAMETDEQDMLAYYASQNYAVVQIQWATAWEQTSVASVQDAACRPATFLNYIYNTVYTTIATGQNANPSAGMCAQGFSAGSAAIAYSLAYYGAGSYLDNVELISGPVLSDIKKGCIVPAASSVTVCQLPNGGTQYGCRLGSDAPWELPPIYAHNDTTYVRA
jgi:hypothetical protein